MSTSKTIEQVDERLSRAIKRIEELEEKFSDYIYDFDDEDDDDDEEEFDGGCDEEHVTEEMEEQLSDWQKFQKMQANNPAELAEMVKQPPAIFRDMFDKFYV